MNQQAGDIDVDFLYVVRIEQEGARLFKFGRSRNPYKRLFYHRRRFPRAALTLEFVASGSPSAVYAAEQAITEEAHPHAVGRSREFVGSSECVTYLAHLFSGHFGLAIEMSRSVERAAVLSAAMNSIGMTGSLPSAAAVRAILTAAKHGAWAALMEADAPSTEYLTKEEGQDLDSLMESIQLADLQCYAANAKKRPG